MSAFDKAVVLAHLVQPRHCLSLMLHYRRILADFLSGYDISSISGQVTSEAAYQY